MFFSGRKSIVITISSYVPGVNDFSFHM